jgi:hypothetical protein
MINKPNFTGWQYYKGFDIETKTEINIGIKKTNEDGSVSFISLQDPNVAEWLANGGTPLPAEEQA